VLSNKDRKEFYDITYAAKLNTDRNFNNQVHGYKAESAWSYTYDSSGKKR